nr:MAG TPA: protein of unknown function (DUF4969) [Caudoviricetes sp.]
MMKKIVFTVLTLVLMLSLCSCSKDSAPAPSSDPATPPDLTGEWKQVNSNSDDAWQAATITGDTITINWVSDGGDTKSLYWAGTFTAPTTADEPYSWDSANDKEQTGKALLASGDETKTFTYANGQLSYEASALGTTMTVKMEKVG